MTTDLKLAQFPSVATRDVGFASVIDRINKGGLDERGLAKLSADLATASTNAVHGRVLDVYKRVQTPAEQPNEAALHICKMNWAGPAVDHNRVALETAAARNPSPYFRETLKLVQELSPIVEQARAIGVDAAALAVPGALPEVAKVVEVAEVEEPDQEIAEPVEPALEAEQFPSMKRIGGATSANFQRGLTALNQAVSGGSPVSAEAKQAMISDLSAGINSARDVALARFADSWAAIAEHPVAQKVYCQDWSAAKLGEVSRQLEALPQDNKLVKEAARVADEFGPVAYALGKVPVEAPTVAVEVPVVPEPAVAAPKVPEVATGDVGGLTLAQFPSLAATQNTGSVAAFERGLAAINDAVANGGVMPKHELASATLALSQGLAGARNQLLSYPMIKANATSHPVYGLKFDASDLGSTATKLAAMPQADRWVVKATALVKEMAPLSAALSGIRGLDLPRVREPEVPGPTFTMPPPRAASLAADTVAVLSAPSPRPVPAVVATPRPAPVVTAATPVAAPTAVATPSAPRPRLAPFGRPAFSPPAPSTAVTPAVKPPEAPKPAVSTPAAVAPAAPRTGLFGKRPTLIPFTPRPPEPEPTPASAGSRALPRLAPFGRPLGGPRIEPGGAMAALGALERAKAAQPQVKPSSPGVGGPSIGSV